MSGLSRECRTCCRKSRIKFSRQTKKQARIFQARKYEVHIFQQEASLFPAWPASTFPSGASRPIPPATILSIPAHNPQQANSLPPGLAGRRLTFLPTTFLTSTKHHLPTKYRSPPFFHSSSFFYFLYRRQHPSGLRLSVPTSHHFPNALHFFRPAAASPTRRPNAKRSFARGCSLQGCRWCGRGARVSFFFFLFLFFSASLFSLSFLISLAPRLRRDAFIFLFIFSFSFYSDFLFLFFLCSFFLLFLSFYFCSYLCFLVFYFYFCFYFYLCLLYFFSLFFFLVFIFASSFLFFVFLFVLLFYPPYSNLFPHYPTARQPFIFSLPPPIFPIPSSHFPAAAKRKKISAKESTGERWPHGSERAAGGKAEGRNGVLRGMEKDMYTTREKIREKKKWAPPGAGWFPGWNFAERRALPPKAAGRERKGGRKGEKCVCFICLFFPLFFVHLYKHKK